MADVKKAGLVGGLVAGAVATGVSAQADLPTQEGIQAIVTSMMGGGGAVSGGSGGSGGEINIGGGQGMSIADASGGDHNIAFVS